MDFIYEYKNGVHYFKIPEKEGTDFDIGDGCDLLYDIFSYPESLDVDYDEYDGFLNFERLIDENDERLLEDYDEDDDYDDDDYEMEENPTLYYETITDDDGKFSHIEVRIEEGPEGNSSYYECTDYDIEPKVLFEYLVGDKE